MPRQPYILKDGTKAPGVTSIIKTIGFGTDPLISWANRIGLEGIDQKTELRRMGDIGSAAHEHFEGILRGKPYEPRQWPDEIQAAAVPCVEAFREWRKGKRVTYVASELPLVSERWRCGGTFDVVARIDGGPLTLLDFKTSSGLRETYLAQIAAYIDMIEEVWGKRIETGILVRLGRDGTADELIVSGDMLERGRALFRLALELYRLEQDVRRDVRSAKRVYPVVALPTAKGAAK